MPLMENLRRYREKAGYKQAKDFADIVGIKYPNYMAYENKGAWPSQENLIRIAAALHVSIDELLGYTAPNDHQRCIQTAKLNGLKITEHDGLIDVDIAKPADSKKIKQMIENNEIPINNLSKDDFDQAIIDAENELKGKNKIQFMEDMLFNLSMAYLLG